MDIERVQAYLRERLSRPSLRVEHAAQIPGGASRDTWSFDISWNEGGGQHEESLVFRLDPAASVLESGRHVEYEVYRAVASTREIPVPEVLFLEDDIEALGQTFFVMRKVSGSSSLPDLQSEALADQRPAIADHWMRIGASIATLDWESLGLGKILAVPTLETTWEVELDKWEKVVIDHELEVRPTMHAALRWLRRNPPAPAQRISLVHADFRSGNYLYEDGRITAMLDWEMAHLGDPIEDLGYAFGGAWRAEEADSLVGWVIEAEEAIRLWSKYSGLTVDRKALHWWTVFGMMKLNALFWTGAWEFAQGRTKNHLLPMITYMFVERQDGWLLDAMGVPRLEPAAPGPSQ
jgi:aminoglycoside phosphotransferase (APT) family kinase protein